MFKNMDYIYAVYQEQSFSKAADKLFISQPSLSATVKKVEKRIGAPLFDRSTNPIQLTTCGKEYIRAVEKIRDIETDFENYLGNLNELKTGNLVIGASNSFMSFILPPVIARFRLQYPGVSISLIEADTSSLEARLFSGALDLMVDNYNLSEETYAKQIFYSESLILAVPAVFASNHRAEAWRMTPKDIMNGQHLKYEQQAVPLQIFEKDPFILLREGNDTRVRADRIFAANSLRPNVIMELDQLATAFNIARQGMGISIISDTLARTMRTGEDLAFYKLDDAYTRRDNYFYYKKNRYITRSMQEFLKLAERE